MTSQPDRGSSIDDDKFGVDADGVPHAYRRAITEFAAALDLDADTLMQGGRLDSAGLGLWLMHHGDRDPKGMTVFADVGELPEAPEEQLVILRELLEKNALTPGAIAGYYGVIPDTSTCVLCMRVSLENVESEGDALGAVVASLITGVDKTRELLQLVTDEIVKRTADAPLERV